LFAAIRPGALPKDDGTPAKLKSTEAPNRKETPPAAGLCPQHRVRLQDFVAYRVGAHGAEKRPSRFPVAGYHAKINDAVDCRIPVKLICYRLARIESHGPMLLIPLAFVIEPFRIVFALPHRLCASVRDFTDHFDPHDFPSLVIMRGILPCCLFLTALDFVGGFRVSTLTCLRQRNGCPKELQSGSDNNQIKADASGSALFFETRDEIRIAAPHCFAKLPCLIVGYYYSFCRDDCTNGSQQ
jgi:hypothetical protein